MFDLAPSLMSQFHMQEILGFGQDPLPPFGTMSLNPVFFILKASLCKVEVLFEVKVVCSRLVIKIEINI